MSLLHYEDKILLLNHDVECRLLIFLNQLVYRESNDCKAVYVQIHSI